MVRGGNVVFIYRTLLMQEDGEKFDIEIHKMNIHAGPVAIGIIISQVIFQVMDNFQLLFILFPLRNIYKLFIISKDTVNCTND